MSSHARHSAMLSISTAPPSAPDKSQTSTSQHAPTPSQSTTTSPGLRVPSSRKTIYDRHLNRSRTAELSKSSFAYLFGEMVTYAQRRVTGIQDLERRYANVHHLHIYIQAYTGYTD
jgi:hypothetical protein